MSIGAWPREKIERHLVAMGVPAIKARDDWTGDVAAAVAPIHPKGDTRELIQYKAYELVMTLPIMIHLPFPPRTKKNHGRGVAKQSAAYVAFRQLVVDGLHGFTTLPDKPYNLAATFYVDVRGKRADLTGLLQGLCDALQDAGVISDDWYFRTFDGCRIVFDDPTPRTELTITPIGA